MATITAEHKRIKEPRTAREAAAMAGKDREIEHWFELEIKDPINFGTLLLNVPASDLPKGAKVGDQITLAFLEWNNIPTDMESLGQLMRDIQVRFGPKKDPTHADGSGRTCGGPEDCYVCRTA